MAAAGVADTQSCPSCTTTLPVLSGYLTWCHACGWNLASPPRPELAPPTPVDRLAATVGRHLGDRLAAQLIAASSLEPRLTPSRAAAFAIAGAVHLLTLGFVAAGVAVSSIAFPNPFTIVLGVILVGTAWLMRPRLLKAPEEGLLARPEAPAVYALADEVAAALGVPPADLIAISDEFNASWSVVGVRRKRVLTIGLPLVSALRPAELVAVVAHEFAHDRNGDARRGIFVGGAANGLCELYSLLAPSGVHFGDLALFARLSNGLLWLVSRPVRWLLMLELLLLLRDRQRAEYLADALAADVAGTDAAVALAEKMLLASTVHSVIQRRVHARGEDGDLFGEIAAAVHAVPGRERERRRRVARMEDARIDDTHPPTGLRIRLLEERPPRAARVMLDAERYGVIDAELSRMRRSMHEHLIDAYRARLYA